MSQLVDQYQRKFEYLRLSITDVCNFKCTYCLPDGYHRQHKATFLTLPEIRHLVAGFASMGAKKVRITGGEPSLRRDLCEIIETVKTTPGIEKVAMTTNGYRMARDASHWRQAGLDSINVSMDSLDANMFHQITGENLLHKVMTGIDAAFAAGFNQVKVNTVLMKGLNSHELASFLAWIKPRNIQLRFIELMQTGDNQALFKAHHVSGASIMVQLLAQGWIEKVRQSTDGPARVFCHPDYQGEIGLIMPYESHFCDSCNRLRVSALGRLHLCLFGEQGTQLRPLLQQSGQLPELQQMLLAALATKRPTHLLHQGEVGGTYHLASVGG